MNTTRFEQIWGDIMAQGEPAPPAETCVYADRFEAWVRQLVTSAGALSQLAVLERKLLLAERYMELRKNVPKPHRNREGKGHRCIWHVYEETWEHLTVVQLSLTPPSLLLTPAPAPTPPAPVVAQISGFYVGEAEDEPIDEADNFQP